MIPLVDLKAQYQQIKDEVRTAIDGVLESGQFVLGEEVAAFEREFAAFSGTDHAVAVNSGTSALHLALLAAGIGSGDEVITVPFTFVATAAAIAYTGARPVFGKPKLTSSASSVGGMMRHGVPQDAKSGQGSDCRIKPDAVKRAPARQRRWRRRGNDRPRERRP